MDKQVKQYPNPKFSSLEEEEKYWKTHSPLDEGFEVEVETSEQRRSSFLSVRLTGSELSKLREMAAKHGIGPSTYARLVLKSTIEQNNWGIQYPFSYLYNSVAEDESSARRPRICIFDTDAININPDVVGSFLDFVRRAYNCRMVTPEDADYEQVERLVKAQP